MKAEHREIIDRAKLHGYYPSTIAHELLDATWSTRWSPNCAVSVCPSTC